jgi:hypothetical protein
MFSCFALPDSFPAVPRASLPVYMFSAVPRSSGHFFMFYVPEVVFGGTGGVGFRFQVLRSRTHFRRYQGSRYRGRWVPFSFCACPYSFSAVPRASGLVFMFCSPELVFRGTESVGSSFLVLRSRTHFRRYRGRPLSFSCFARPNSFSAVPRASGPVFIFCARGLILDGSEGVGSRFHVLRARTLFLRY